LKESEISKIDLKIKKKSYTFKLLPKLIFNQQSAAPQKVPPGPWAPRSLPLLRHFRYEPGNQRTYWCYHCSVSV